MTEGTEPLGTRRPNLRSLSVARGPSSGSAQTSTGPTHSEAQHRVQDWPLSPTRAVLLKVINKDSRDLHVIDCSRVHNSLLNIIMH